MSTAIVLGPPPSNADRHVALDVLIAHLRNEADPQRRKLSAAQWQALVEEAGRHKVAAALYRPLTDGPLGDAMPAAVRSFLKDFYVATSFRNTLLLRETARAVDALAETNVPVMLLKGIHLVAGVYPDRGARSMFDIDVLVHRHDLAKAEHAFLALGYGPHDRPDMEKHCSWSNHLARLTKDGAAPVEVHYHIERPGNPFAIDMGELWDRAERVRVGDANAWALHPEHLLLHLCLHTSYHHRFDRAALKGLLDVATVVRQAGERLDWARLVETANRWEMGRFAWSTLRLTEAVLEVDMPADTLAGLARVPEDEAMVDVALRYLLTPEMELPDAYRAARRRGRAGRTAALAAGVFPPPARMREIYGLRPGSPLAYPYYAIRLGDLLIRRGTIVLRMLFRTADTRSTLQRDRDRARIEEWVGDLPTGPPDERGRNGS
jgi:hypothetical protein